MQEENNSEFPQKIRMQLLKGDNQNVRVKMTNDKAQMMDRKRVR
jgi:hypothetical protein